MLSSKLFVPLLLLASLTFLLRFRRSLRKLATSFYVALFFLWYGPDGFLVLKKKSGKAMFHIGRNNAVVFNLRVIKHCLVANAANYDKGGRAARLMGDVVGPHGILGALDEDDHKGSHAVLNPHTKRADRLQDFEDIVLQETRRMLQQWEPSSEVDLYISFNDVFFTVLYRFMFGMQLSSSGFHKVLHTISTLERFSAVVGFVPAKLLPLYRKYRSDIQPLLHALDAIVEDIVQQADPSSPLGELQDPSSNVTPVQLKDTVRNLLFAGATTAANSLGWAVHLISRHPHLKHKATVAAKAQDLSFFKNVCLETNRIYPQANVVTRRAVKDDVVDGIRIAANTVLVIPIIALQRDPEFFPRANEFDPDRWDHDKLPPLMSYIPFTAGPRQCIGQSLFNRVGPLFLMQVFAKFSFAPLQHDVKPKWPNAVLPPRAGGFKMKARCAE